MTECAALLLVAIAAATPSAGPRPSARQTVESCVADMTARYSLTGPQQEQARLIFADELTGMIILEARRRTQPEADSDERLTALRASAQERMRTLLTDKQRSTLLAAEARRETGASAVGGRP